MSDQDLKFIPRVNDRMPSGSWFAEFFPLPGPEVVGETGRGTQRDRYGWNWLVLLTHSLEAQIWQEQPAGSGNWVRQYSRLPPVFNAPLPDGARRVSAVFDQAGRLVVAYEHEQLVRVTRWDPIAQEYVQNVTFAGVNPALTIDAHAGLAAEDSDVLIYYQPPSDLAQVRVRVQRELYLTEHTVYAADQPLILDRAHTGVLTQLYVSAADGLPLIGDGGELMVLAGPFYPRYVEDPVLVRVTPARARYEATTLVVGIDDPVLVRAEPARAEYVSNLQRIAVTDRVLVCAEPARAAYADDTIRMAVTDPVLVRVTPARAAYTAHLVEHALVVDVVAVGAASARAEMREV